MSKKRYSITASTFDSKGRLLVTRSNEYNRSHPLMKHFALLAGESEHKMYKHAELSAILASGDKVVDSILVQRYDAYGRSAQAKPCLTCQKMLKAYGVRVARYTTSEGIQELQLKDD